MKNYVTPGENLQVPAPEAVTSGTMVVIGAIFGVANSDAANGADVVITRRGEFTLPKLSAQAWAIGDLVYWDAGNDRCTTVSSGNTLIGAATAVAANPSTTGRVLLDGTVR